jgi:hypothetical protein
MNDELYLHETTSSKAILTFIFDWLVVIAQMAR